MKWIDIHTHQIYQDETKYIFNSFLNISNVSSYYSCGIHPRCIQDAELMIELLERILCEQPLLLKAVGECGLDKLSVVDISIQKIVFEQQIILANHYLKPLIIHCVKAYQECLTMLKKAKVPVIFHGFDKHPQVAYQIIKSGAYVSIGKKITNKIDKLKAVLDIIPLRSLFMETDDEDIHIREIYNSVGMNINLEIQTLQEQMQDNYKKVFY